MGLKDKYYKFKDKHFRKDFFISYHNSPGKGENCVAKKIHQVLKRKCYSDYYNPEHFEFNEQYAERLHRKVKECKVFIWLITDDYFKLRRERDGSIARNWFLAEILWAYKYQKRICIVIDKETYKDVTMKEVADCFQQGFEPLCNYKNYDAFDDTDKELVKKFLDQLFNGGSVRSNRICTFGAYDKIKIEKESGQKRGSRKKEIEKAAKKIIKGAKNENKNAKKSVNGNKPIRVYRKKLWLIHTMVFVLSLAGGVAYKVITTDPTVWDGSTTVDGGWSSVEGNGTKESPYKIRTAKQLAWLSYTSQSDSYSGKHFELEADITLNSYAPGGILNNIGTSVSLDETEDNRIEDPDATHYWTPIGSKEYPFEGTFDGKGHMIYGLLIKDEQNYQGLFGVCGLESRITNVNIMCATIYTSNAASYIGTIVGKTEGIINKCSVYSAFVCGGKEFIGGIAGEANIISNSFASLWVTGSRMQENSDENIKYKYGGYKGGVAGKCGYLINCGGSLLPSSVG